MRILALETSGRLGSVAALHVDNGRTEFLDERRLPATERSARTLLPAVKLLLADHDWRPADLDIVCATTGPGSFTGLRIGVVAAKTLAYATGAALVPVHTLAALAAGFEQPAARLWTVLEAQRQELFAACFDPSRTVVDQATPATEILAVDGWLSRLRAGDVVLGPPLAKLRDRVPSDVVVAGESAWSPSASATARLAVQIYELGIVTPPLELVPRYYRKSAAEEKRPV